MCEDSLLDIDFEWSEDKSEFQKKEVINVMCGGGGKGNFE